MDGGHLPYMKYLNQLSEADKIFFYDQYNDPKQFVDTKKEVGRRIDKLLKEDVFARMFSATETNLDLFALTQQNKIIVINADRNLLGKQGTEVYARFFIALIGAMARERLTLPESERKPCYVYLDEFGDYAGKADTHITDLLTQARKVKVGLTIGHTKLIDLSDETAAALEGLTSSKYMADIRPQDASRLARSLRCEPEFIQNQPQGTFAAYIKGATTTALPLTFKPDALKAYTRMEDEEFEQVRWKMREQYAQWPEQERQTEEPNDEDFIDAEFEVVDDEPDGEPTYEQLRITARKATRKRQKKRGRPS